MVDWHETRRSWIPSIFVFLLSLEALILFALILPLLLLSFFFSPWWPFAQNSTLQVVCACGT
jgi:hypothetical protein